MAAYRLAEGQVLTAYRQTLALPSISNAHCAARDMAFEYVGDQAARPGAHIQN